MKQFDLSDQPIRCAHLATVTTTLLFDGCGLCTLGFGPRWFFFASQCITPFSDNLLSFFQFCQVHRSQGVVCRRLGRHEHLHL